MKAALYSPASWEEISTWAAIFTSTLSSRTHLVIPELEKGIPTITSTQKSTLRAWVSAGGRLYVGGASNSRTFLNDLFDWGLSVADFGSSAVASRTFTANSYGSDLPATLAYANAVRSLYTSSLPDRGEALYMVGSTQAPVVAIPYGSGVVLWIGHDFYEFRTPTDWASLTLGLTKGTFVNPSPSPGPAPGTSELWYGTCKSIALSCVLKGLVPPPPPRFSMEAYSVRWMRQVHPLCAPC